MGPPSCIPAPSPPPRWIFEFLADAHRIFSLVHTGYTFIINFTLVGAAVLFYLVSFLSDTAIVINRPDIGDFGTMFKIVPYTTQNFANQMTCFKVPGEKEAKVTAQGVLPDVSLFNKSSYNYHNHITSY